MRIITRIIALLFLALVVFLLWPSPLDSVSWSPKPIPPLTGSFEKNNKLDAMERIYEGLCIGCEDVAIDSTGVIYGSALNGEIVRFVGDHRSVFANTNGRPLGLDFDSEGNLIVADADKGLLSIDSNGEITVLATGHGNKPFKFTDDVEVGSDGIFYFSDASSKWTYHDNIRDLVEHGGHGRLLTYDPRDRQVRMLMEGLQFANGIAVAEDASFVLVNETGQSRVTKYWLEGPRAGEHEWIIPNLPGYPDGVSRGENGIFWLTLVSPRDELAEKSMPYAWVRNQVFKLPRALVEPKPKRYGMVLGFDDNGNIHYNLQSENPKLFMITSVQQAGSNLYLGSLVDSAIGRMEL